MAVTRDIVRTWRGPRAVVRDLLALGKREDRAVAILIAACLIFFVADWPRLSRIAAGFEAAPDEAVRGMSELLTYGAFTWLIIAPLFFYAVAAVSHLIARAVGGKGDHYGARVALFWAMLAAGPALLLYGLTLGFMGPQAIQTTLVGAIWMAAFLWFWLAGLVEAET